MNKQNCINSLIINEKHTGSESNHETRYSPVWPQADAFGRQGRKPNSLYEPPSKHFLFVTGTEIIHSMTTQ
jgi:hypothetical protein